LLADLQNYFTTAKSSKFPTKPILGYPLHLKCVAALPWKTLKSEICNSHARKKRFKCDFFITYSTDKETPNVAKTSAEINTIKNINILLFVRSLSLTSLMLCS